MPNCRVIVIPAHASGRGGKKSFLENIKAWVIMEHLQLQIPWIRFEGNSGSDFYVGIAVICDDDSIDLLKQQLFSFLGNIGQRVPQYFTNKDPLPPTDTAFLKGRLELDSFTEPIDWEPDEEIYDRFSAESNTDPEILEGNNQRINKLLWWCSAKGAGSLTKFYEIAERLGVPSNKSGYRSILRAFESLGHLEVDYSKKQWGIAQSTIVNTANEREWYLAGQRVPLIINAISKKCNPECIPQTGAPDVIKLSEDPGDDAIGLHDSRLIRVGNASQSLAEQLPDIEDWATCLTREIDVREHNYDFERYDDQQFNAVSSENLIPGLYQLTHRQTKMSTKLFFDGHGQWFSGDFYGLAFLTLHLCKSACLARWTDDNTLFIPIKQRWPAIYERCLVLASGFLPERKTTSTDILLAYRGIPRDMAEHLCHILYVNLRSKE